MCLVGLGDAFIIKKQMENGLFPRDVVCVIARTLVEETFVLEALMMCWTCKHWRLSLTRDRTLWKSALRLLSGSVQNFNLPERDYLLDGVEDEQYPLPVSIPALACANCVKLENELLVDLFPLCVTFLKSESRLIREAVNQMTLNDSSCFWSLRAVAEWQIQHSIALPRPFRRLFQFCAGGATFCDGLFRLWSLEEIAAKRETPKTTLYSVLQTSPLQNDKHLAALIRESPVHGVRSSSIESMLGKPNLHEVGVCFSFCFVCLFFFVLVCGICERS